MFGLIWTLTYPLTHKGRNVNAIVKQIRGARNYRDLSVFFIMKIKEGVCVLNLQHGWYISNKLTKIVRISFNIDKPWNNETYNTKKYVLTKLIFNIEFAKKITFP